MECLLSRPFWLRQGRRNVSPVPSSIGLPTEDALPLVLTRSSSLWASGPGQSGLHWEVPHLAPAGPARLQVAAETSHAPARHRADRRRAARIRVTHLPVPGSRAAVTVSLEPRERAWAAGVDREPPPL